MEAPMKKNIIFRLIDRLSEIGGSLSAVLLWIIAVIVTYEVVVRYLFNAPTTWVQESSVYLWMGGGMLGAACALKNNSHFSITIFIDKLSEKNRRRMQIVTSTIGFCYATTFIYQGYQQAVLAYELDDISTGLMAMPLWIPWMLIPTGGTLLALQFVSKIAEEISNEKQAGHEERI